ncbi:hypothetical protein G6F57_002896 [Rhizopus arrhizus]|nr:hypothetical protein G6F23_003986 [Rhizopus arrhizus]KAG1428198.1 hypothetical protein G6F58_000688 [Rhizopus delemar]KAG0768593.1 hypothetical protein G6F24_001810 [Rhizopus arrhizus]KAG0788405.1 hypothetical protein G6F21_007237 [Rhizopus arrhizus]KAG0796925.1 hypothetical protein G6F22_004808 [Rhizopus arrhizus]
MNTCHVVTTISPPTAVTSAARGCFTQPAEENLIVCKGSTVEIYKVMLDGIKLFMEFSIYGTIRNLQVIQLPDKSTCSLFILTVHQCYTIITYSIKTQSIVTEFSGQLNITNARETDQQVVVTVDKTSEMIFVSAFTGYVIAIPFGKPVPGAKLTSKNRDTKASRFMQIPIRTNEFDFISVAALQQGGYLSVLVGEMEDLKTIKTFKYRDEYKDLLERNKSIIKVEASTHVLVPVPEPLGGLLVIGEYIITYFDPLTNTNRELSIDPARVTAWEFMKDESNRYLLGDEEGYLYVFSIETSHNKIVNLSSTFIGQVSRPSCIVDLGNLMFYIGSTHGDSCLIQLIKGQEKSKYTVNVLSTYSCLGPIVDFCLYDYNKQGKQTMACCAGVEKDASIRIVENGIGFSKKYTLDFPLVYAVWTLNLDGDRDSLLISTALDTVLLKPSVQEELEVTQHTSYSALDTSQMTLAAGMFNSFIVQATSSFVRMMTNDEYGQLIGEWKPPTGTSIAIAKIKGSHCVVCCEGDMIIYLEMTKKGFIEKSKRQLKNASCISISTRKENETRYNYVVAGTCGSNPSVVFLQLPDLELVLEHKDMPSTTGPNDLLVVTMEKVLYLMVLLGDGQMFSYHMEVGSEDVILESETEIMVGTYCTAMYPYQHGQEKRVFVAGQRPTVISSFHQTLFVYSVNLTNVYALAKYNDLLVLMTENQLLFGQNDMLSKLHHTKYELPGEMPLRIEYISDIKALAVASCTNVHDPNKNIIERTGKVRLLDAQTFQVMDTFELPTNEVVESMTITRFSEYPEEYLFVGTLIENHEDPNNNTGRILAFTIENSRCELIDAVDMPGVVYRMESIKNTIIAAVDGKIYGLYNFKPDLLKGERIEFKFLLHNNVVALDMDTNNNDTLLVGDLMESMSLLKVEKDEESLKLSLEAVDNKQVWMTAVKFVNENVLIGADDRHNLFTMIKPEIRQEGKACKLELEGGYHLGTLVNRFRKDILRDVENASDNIDCISKYGSEFTFATVNGSIGTVKTISRESFEFFKGIQEGILNILPNNGNLDHGLWRKYRPKYKVTRMNDNYLDGDILKLFSSMNLLEKQKLLEHYKNVSVQQLEKWIYHLVS